MGEEILWTNSRKTNLRWAPRLSTAFDTEFQSEIRVNCPGKGLNVVLNRITSDTTWKQ